MNTHKLGCPLIDEYNPNNLECVCAENNTTVKGLLDEYAELYKSRMKGTIGERQQEIVKELEASIRKEVVADILEIAHRDGKEFYFGAGADISVNLTKLVMSIRKYALSKGITLK